MNAAAIRQRLDAYEKLVRLDKPIGILLLLWPTLWGLWIAARGAPNPWAASAMRRASAALSVSFISAHPGESRDPS